jgi:mRNA interferase MazF
MVAITPGPENGLDKKSVIDLFQVRSVAEERLVRLVGTIGRDQGLQVKEALKVVFGF